MIVQTKRTMPTGFKRGTMLIRSSVVGVNVGRDKLDHTAAKLRVHARLKAGRLSKEACRAEQAALIERLAHEAGMTVPMLRAAHLLG